MNWERMTAYKGRLSDTEPNTHRSGGRAHASNRHSSGVQETSVDNDELKYSSTMIEASSQGDSITHENIAQEMNCVHDVSDKEEEAAAEAVEASEHKSFSSHPVSVSTRHLSRRTSHSKFIRSSHSEMRVPACMTKYGSRHSKHIDQLHDEPLQPPVTLSTLHELDLHSIQNNLNLRIDICHDPELFFQPISGRKGDVKKEEASKYWSSLVAEFLIYQHNVQFSCSDCRQMRASLRSTRSLTFRPQLPAMFENLKEIVQMLVPETDHEEVDDHLDTDLLMQQVRMGNLDAVRLSNWLAKLLTSHCAPMRDRAAAEIVELIQEGTERSNMEIFVRGLEQLFNLLEAMKLDIANHQIRSFRYPLIEGTVEFQQDCFAKAIEAQQIDVTDSARWYRNVCFDHRHKCGFDEKSEAAQRFECFIHGLVYVCNPYEKTLPLTLQYDQHRIIRLREDLQDHIQMNLCLGVFNQQVQEFAGSSCDPSPKYDELKQRIIALTEDDDGNGGAISDHLDAIGMEIARAAFAMRPPKQESNRTLNSFDFDRAIRSLYAVFRNEDQYCSVTESFLSSLEARTMQYAEHFLKLTTLEISNAQKHWAQARTVKDVLLAEWDEMARKLAHIGVVHWRVWRDLCYWTSDVFERENNSEDEQDSFTIIEISDEPTSHVSSGRRPSVLISNEFEKESNHGMALIQGSAAMQRVGIDPHIQRQDSGFAEFADDIESKHCYDPDIDINPDLEDGNRYSSNTSKGKSGGNRVSKLR